LFCRNEEDDLQHGEDWFSVCPLSSFREFCFKKDRQKIMKAPEGAAMITRLENQAQ
jgi:hypothetical protein